MPVCLSPSREYWLSVSKEATAGYTSREGPEGMYDSGRSTVRQIQQMGILDFGDVLDIGCGNGRIAMALSEFSGIKYLGVDVMRQPIAFCKKAFFQYTNFHFEHLDIENAAFNPMGTRLADIYSFQYPCLRFDTVILSSVLTHSGRIDVAKNLMRETFRVLKRGGMAYVTWFRSPPNARSQDCARTVYAEAEILEMVKPFEVISTREGLSTDYHDQWKMVLKKN